VALDLRSVVRTPREPEILIVLLAEPESALIEKSLER
jgi:hypothetical protein